ncbi:XRCC1 [Drosophila busckii]|uniref:XRCC1 n=1 Tax=Drosophila busckii TaxID=30019 RepID=A0A0M4EQU6_DROBS|nr:DNA repair protein XRCC1 [Drosophila busckii]XP_017852823.1 DNA repair protein XRCC1 [Drosophila busckii]ALC48365.1 XRCC1 [Drosophila busckii]
MAIGTFKSVREVSSEDSLHLAANLLKQNAGKKWKTKNIGEKTAYVILEFEEPQQITGMDIGNEHAAFVEVLVSNSGCQPDDFKEMMLSSSFMTPIESKNSSNVNRVRWFDHNSLNAATLPDKWKLLKIVVTQPFNKHVQYGISFIKVHVTARTSTSSSASASTSTSTNTSASASATASIKAKPLVPDKFKLAGSSSLAFKMREDSPDSEPDSTLFQRWKATRNDTDKPAASAAAAIRDAGSPAGLRRLSETKPTPKMTRSASKAPTASATVTKSEAKTLDRNRASLLFGDDEDDDDDSDEPLALLNARQQRMSKHIEADKNRRRLELEAEQKKKDKNKRLSIETPATKEAAKSTPERSQKVQASSTSEKKETNKKLSMEAPASTSKAKPTPDRSQKRLSSSVNDDNKPAKKLKISDTKIIKYVPFKQLLSDVVLVISGIQNPDRTDLRSKALAMGAKYKSEWDSGCTHLICAFRSTPKYNQMKGKGKIVTRSWIEKCYDQKKYLPWRRYALVTSEAAQNESDDEIYDESLRPTVVDDDDNNDIEFVPNKPVETVKLDDSFDSIGQRQMESGPDTEDELERVAQQNQLKANEKSKTHKRNTSEISTEEEDYLHAKEQELREAT